MAFSQENQCLLAIYVRRFKQQVQLFSMRGTSLHYRSIISNFRVPDFIKPQELEPILPFLPATEIDQSRLDGADDMDSDVPARVGAPVRNKIYDFWQEANNVYLQHAETMDNAHGMLADATASRLLHLHEIGAKLLGWTQTGSVSSPSWWALHRALMNQRQGVLATLAPLDHWKYMTWEILPRSYTDVMDQVSRWVHSHYESVIAQEHRPAEPERTRKNPHKTGETVISRFVDQVRPLVLASRKTRMPISDFGLGPYAQGTRAVAEEEHSDKSMLARFAKRFNSVFSSSKQSQVFTTAAFGVTKCAASDRQTHQGEIPAELFNASSVDDETYKILHFLYLWAEYSAVLKKSSISSSGPAILRATGLYNDVDLGKAAASLFLREVGFLPAWQQPLGRLQKIAVPDDDSGSAGESPVSLADDSVEALDSADRMEHIRKDWGDLEVFCVDEVSTTVIDDGFSLQPVSGESGMFWIHVHIANPTAFLPHSHPVARAASRFVTSVHAPAMHVPMLPESLTRKFSLRAGSPTLTFSYKVNEAAQVSDSYISAGRIHNVTHISYDVLGSFLQAKKVNDIIARHTVGPETVEKAKRASQMTDTLTADQVDSFRTFWKLSQAILSSAQSSIDPWRNARGGKASVQGALIKPPGQFLLSDVRGDPSIQMQGPIMLPENRGAWVEAATPNLLVTALMLLVGREAALWCRQRNIPLIYLSSRVDSALPPISEFREKILHPALQKDETSEAVQSDYMKLYGRSVYTPYPARHEILDFDAYAHVTSPLRRYIDMVNHWQIEATLLHEAAMHESPGACLEAKPPSAALPFSAAEVAELCKPIEMRRTAIKSFKNESTRHWQTQLLFRKFYFADGDADPLPKVLTFIVATLGRVGGLGVICELNAQGILRESKIVRDAGGLKQATRWKVRIESIDTIRRRVWLEALARDI